MTKILKIEGTDIRLEIERCGRCPCYDGEFDMCLLAVDAGLRTEGNLGYQDMPQWCPLPDKKFRCSDWRERWVRKAFNSDSRLEIRGRAIRRKDGKVCDGFEQFICLGHDHYRCKKCGKTFCGNDVEHFYHECDYKG